MTSKRTHFSLATLAVLAAATLAHDRRAAAQTSAAAVAPKPPASPSPSAAASTKEKPQAETPPRETPLLAGIRPDDTLFELPTMTEGEVREFLAERDESRKELAASVEGRRATFGERRREHVDELKIKHHALLGAPGFMEEMKAYAEHSARIQRIGSVLHAEQRADEIQEYAYQLAIHELDRHEAALKAIKSRYDASRGKK